MTKIGVLALQGDFREHIEMLHELGLETAEVRKAEHLNDLDGLIMPGGESTAFGKLARSSNMIEPLRAFIQVHPTWGTCAGAIFLAKTVEAQQPHLALMDITVQRNAFGRQIDSFIAPLTFKGLDDTPYDAVFIRAPIISAVGPGVEVLARLPNGTIVAAREGHLLATSFHPELTRDDRIHRYFVGMVERQIEGQAERG